MSGMLLRLFKESPWQQREPHFPWIDYRFVHVGDWNTSSLLGILFCLLWQKPWLIVQSEQESQSHQYSLMKSSPFINRDLISRHLSISRPVQGTLEDSETLLSDQLTCLPYDKFQPLEAAGAMWGNSREYRPCSRTWDLHTGPWWRTTVSWCAPWTVLTCEGFLGLWGTVGWMRAPRQWMKTNLGP